MPFLTYAQALELRRELEGTGAEVVCPGSDNYAASITGWSDLCEKEAGAVVLVRSTSEVSIVVRFARKHHVEFVVKAGGHSTTGASASHGGIVISLSRMRHVLTDPASKTVCAQGGATWEDVNQSTAPHSLAVVGPTASNTGVGGSTLGGGFGWLTGRYGLIIDSLLSVKIVLADGSIVEASEDEHSDLFWAVRGAGQAFGVATEFVFKAHGLTGDIFGGQLYFNLSKLPRILNFVDWFNEQQDPDSGLFFGFSAPSAAEQTLILVSLFYNGPRLKAEAFFSPLLSLHPVVNKSGMMSYAEVNAKGNIDPVPEGRKIMRGARVALPLNTALVYHLWQRFDEIVDAYPQMGRSVLVFELLPYAEIMSVPLEGTACASRGRLYHVGLLLCWRDPELDSRMDKYQREIVGIIESAHQLGEQVEGEQVEGVAAYANYAGHEKDAKYLFGDNLPRLQELKRKYDPQNVFRKWHNLLSHTERHSVK